MLDYRNLKAAVELFQQPEGKGIEQLQKNEALVSLLVEAVSAANEQPADAAGAFRVLTQNLTPAKPAEV